MRHKKKGVAIYKSIAITIFCGILSSCEQKELCYDHNHAYNLNVHFDWHNAPEANPSSMFLYLFPHGTTERVLTREFIGKDGGKTTLPVGEPYDAVCFNSDIRNTLLSEAEDKATFTASSKNCTQIEQIGVSTKSLPRAQGTEEERTVMETDRIWSGTSKEDIMLTLEQSEEEDAYDVTLCPQQLYCTYTIKILHINNQDKISSNISATLSGMAGGRYISSREKTDEKVTVAFPLGIDKKSGTINGQMHNFGNSPVKGTANKLVVYTILTDGTKWYYVYDVTRQIHKAADPYNVEIQLDTLPIPNEIKGNGGVAPGVSDWNTVDVNINM